jgi:hypothetical protein
MLLPTTKILCGNEIRPIRDVREEGLVSGACGWSEMAETQVADVFVQFDYRGPLFTITTSRGACIRCSPDHTCFGRLNPLSRHYQVYLMERSSMGYRVGMSQELTKEIMALQSIRNDLEDKTEIIDRVWIMESTDSLPRAVFLEKYAMFHYGLPNFPFSGKHTMTDLSDEMIRELFSRIDTPVRGRNMLKDAHMYEEFPHITLRMAKAGGQSSSAIQFIVFGGNERPSRKRNFSHLIMIDSSVQLSQAEHRQFKRRMGQRGIWHLEVTREDLEEAQLFVKTLSCLDNLQIVKKIQLTKKAPFYIIPASHLKVGMLVPIVGRNGIEEDIVTSITVSNYEGQLFDLKTSELFNYIAGEWVVMSYNDLSVQPSAAASSAS